MESSRGLQRLLGAEASLLQGGAEGSVTVEPEED